MSRCSRHSACALEQKLIICSMGWDWLFSTIPYGPWWKRHRTLFHQYFNANTTPDHHPVQAKETYVMLQNLAESPDNLPYHVRRLSHFIPCSASVVLNRFCHRTSAAIVMKIMYGHQVWMPAPVADVLRM